ncbi:MAG TPA: YceI family protein [Polyangiaceae bacterium]|nr:YceI family protein [Polyangiaceae bacterium]
MKHLLLVSAAALLLATGCDNEPAAGKAKAEAAAPVEAAPAAAPAATSVKYAFSGADSAFDFTGAKVTAKHDGKFKDFSGTVDLVDGDVTKSSVKAEIKIASLSVEPAKLQGHLLSPDLLDAEKFPTASFESTKIVAGGASGASHTVTGNLTLHGEKKSITFPATITSGDVVTVKAEFAINRKDFGIVYPGMPDDLIKDDVLIKLDIKAKKG